MQVNIREAIKQDLPKLARLISSDEAWQRYGIDIKVALQLLDLRFTPLNCGIGTPVINQFC